MMIYEYSGITLKGINKKINEDRITINGNYISNSRIYGSCRNKILGIVCDGVGGKPFGSIAASIVAKSFIDYIEYNLNIFEVLKIIYISDIKIRLAKKNNKKYHGMATTIAGVYIDEKESIIFNVGDSHVYEIFNGSITLLSKDHTILTSKHSRTKSLNNYIDGQGVNCIPYIIKTPTKKNSLFIICSDGFYNFISNGEILNVISEKLFISDNVEKLLNLSIKNGSVDDISLIIIFIK